MQHQAVYLTHIQDRSGEPAVVISQKAFRLSAWKRRGECSVLMILAAIASSFERVWCRGQASILHFPAFCSSTDWAPRRHSLHVWCVADMPPLIPQRKPLPPARDRCDYQLQFGAWELVEECLSGCGEAHLVGLARDLCTAGHTAHWARTYRRRPRPA
jgi:hypothetical protein